MYGDIHHATLPPTPCQERPDCQAHMVAIDFLPAMVVGRRMAWLAGSLARGVVQPLPVTGFGLGATAPALRHMSQARHTGETDRSGCWNMFLITTQVGF